MLYLEQDLSAVDHAKTVKKITIPMILGLPNSIISEPVYSRKDFNLYIKISNK